MKKKIMGLLAVSAACLYGYDAVSIDMVAKSKASEVGPAAGTYIYLQNVYIADEGKTGTFEQIGYEPPTSHFFNYSDLKPGFVATSRVGLGRCPIGSKWMVKVINGAIYRASVNNEECAKLTPNFIKIGQY